MLYSEVNKIIEAGLDRDREKVKNFALLLAKKLSADGDDRSSKRIEDIIARKNNGSAITDALVSPPVDQESRMGIVDVNYSPSSPSIVLSDSLTENLNNFVSTVRIKDKLETLGITSNMALLLYGPPGCGKTSIANYLAYQLELPLVTARLDTLISSLLGNTAKNLRRVFDYANRQPCVLFLDEFDAIAKARNDQHELGELKRVVNSLLQNIDAYTPNGILIAATNHQELLDDAIWRRFQTVIEVPKPEIGEIKRFFQMMIKDFNINGISEKHFHAIFEQLKGLSYSEIETIIQNAIKKKLIEDEDKFIVFDFLNEIAVFKHHGNISQEELIQFFSECHLSQRAISDYFHISQRQVRKYLINEGEN